MNNIDPILKEVLLQSLEESKKGELKSNEEVFSEIIAMASFSLK